MRKLAHACLLAALALTAGGHAAHAAFTLTIQQFGSNVLVNGSGTLNTTALTPNGSISAGPNFESR